MRTKKQKDNLIPCGHKLTVEEAKKGGKKSVETRRRQKSFAEIAKTLGSCQINDETIRQQFSALGVPVKDGIEINTAIVAGQMVAGIKGSTPAAEWVRSLNEKEEGTSADLAPVKMTAEMMIPPLCVPNMNVSRGEISELIIKGGRGGAKSSYPGLKIPEMIMANPNAHALVVRQVKDTLRDSVFEQIKWGIEQLGVSDRFKCKTSPLMITYIPTGQHIYFRGADDPIKIKSIKPPFGYIGILWFEEFDQYASPEAIRNIKQSAFRGTDENGESSAIVFETFNPPPTASAWVNKYVADIEARRGTPEAKRGTEVVTTCYTDLPRWWLGEAFYSEAEELKKINPRAYRNEYLGEITGTGGTVFENAQVRTITEDEIAQFDRIRQGADWGWFPDPFAFVRCNFDRARRTLYVFAEEYRVKTGNEEIAASVIKQYQDCPIIADSAEQKSIDYFNRNGYRMRGAVKGAGSVEFGIKWLCSLAAIVIDPVRCPHTAAEFQGYEYQKNRDGEFISAYPDKDNHFIDAVRYAMNDEIEETKTIVKRVRY